MCTPQATARVQDPRWTSFRSYHFVATCPTIRVQCWLAITHFVELPLHSKRNVTQVLQSLLLNLLSFLSAENDCYSPLEALHGTDGIC